ncbi:Utp14-domain-containing protein [Melanomma pulvis-pyrius CBS 109.77]|uniref:Utp14-domain-containing protein n=1 Tax=Melanomma pulvis-pyrius CBS 109.77 TaxID=1314802 RepID=A0A6A6XUC6_9PLEO|nr:Utp14-domain-containing protein [Melanomma pulvis-pyrius CBS 109.77]
MPPRISRSSLQGSKASKPRPTGAAGRNPRKAQKRALDAFSIAGHEHSDRIKVRQHRLGELEQSGPSRSKRPRDDEDEDGEADEDGEVKRRKKKDDEESFDEGSDSEGNNWTMGHVEDDGDSDIDSDEAFGESDEEKFEGWTFRGSQSNQKAGKKSKGKKVKETYDDGGDIDLDESDSADWEEEEDEDDLGDDAIDLATALDQYEDSEEEEKPQKSKKSKKAKMTKITVSPFDNSEDEEKPRKSKTSKLSVSAFDDSEDGLSDDEDFAADGSSTFSSEEEDDDEDEEDDKRAQLKDLISSLPFEEEEQPKITRRVEVHESGAPSEFGVFRKVDLASYKPKITDPEKKKSLKLLQDDLKPSKRNDIARKLDAPLPKRQQDKLDRAVANEKANETLGRWTDTVKQNRRAEHLFFPLKHPSAGESFGATSLVPTASSAPTNDLENTIQSILEQSGLSNGKNDEDQIQKWEELQTNKLPLEEVTKRRAQLRKERELLFREEVRSRRIKKIKSKAYRRVHRKERERLAQRERDALKADGVEVSEDEREYNDRRRAEERMGAKHRESKWAKGVKQSGKAAWDDDARAGVTEMARRNEELRRRIEGKEVRGEDDEGSDFSSDEDEDDGDSDEDGNDVLKRQLGRLKHNPFSTDESKLGSMQFMQKAEAARKVRNDEDMELIRRELAGEESNSDVEDENAARVGRRKFGPGSKTATPAYRAERNEFEERPGSDEEAEHEQRPADRIERQSNGISSGRTKAAATKPASSISNGVNPYLTKAPKETDSTKEPDALWKAQDTTSVTVLQKKPKSELKSKSNPKSNALLDDDLPEPQVTAPDADGWQTVVKYGKSDDDEDEEDVENEGIDLGVVLRNQELTAKGFAGDDVEAEFAAEKAALVDEEADKIITTSLPGWGAWVGDGLSKNAQKNKGKKTIEKQKGIRPESRKDAGLDRVIINQKRTKKNTKYLASSLPFPFENKEQYERSLRLPKGQEWTTKQTFQDSTKPRVIVKQGIIRPLHKPLV